nr:MAG TPA: hypothetical protein [Caudoviricetes sp.]
MLLPYKFAKYNKICQSGEKHPAIATANKIYYFLYC